MYAIRSYYGREAHYLDPRRLDKQEIEELRRALVQIEDLQKIIRSNFTIL